MPTGFIGTGNIGTPIAHQLLAAGNALVIHDRRREAGASLTAAGARRANSPAEVAEACDDVVTCLPGPPEMEAVTLGPDGILAGARGGTLFIDHTTNAPALARRVHAAFAARGVAMVDAPVNGREGHAEGERDLSGGGGGEAEAVAVDAVPAPAGRAWGNRLTASAGRAKPNVRYRG